MSKPMPKRLVDMSLAESDSEDTDFKTPIKRITRRMPKKTSELTVVNSESEDEDGDKDNLNQAINLNDSFIFTPSKMINFTPLKSTDAMEEKAVVPSPPKATATQSSIFSLAIGSKLVQENDQNLVNLNVKKDFAAELEKLAITNPVPALPKSQSTSALGTTTSTSQSSQVLKIKNANDDHGDNIIRYRPINQKRVQQQQQQQQLKSSESSSGDSGVSSTIKVFPKAQSVNETKDVPDALKLPVHHEPVFATPGFNKAPVQLTGSRRVPNPRMPVSSARKDQSALKDEFQQRKVLFTTPMGGTCKPVSSIANASISLALDDSIQFATSHRLPDVSEVEQLPPTPQQEPQQPEKNQTDQRQVRRIKHHDYAVEKKIGHGGSSTVFLGRRLDTDQEVALKVVDLQGDDAIINGYLKETELLASLQGNPNIITLHDYFHSEKESLLYMVMEIGDTDLHKILQTYRSDIPLYELMRYWYEMLLAVDFIHQQGVIHLDLKPANFLMVNGRLKLIDFGIAAKINSDATSIVKDSQAGTFNYISPEALTDTSDESSTQNPKFKISTKSDVWSLGCILYSLIYKRTPFAHIKNVMLKVATITNPRNEIPFPDLPIYYPPFLIKMLKTCLKHNPKERASVQDILKFPFEMIIPIRERNPNFK